jgi:hypothetical protein
MQQGANGGGAQQFLKPVEEKEGGAGKMDVGEALMEGASAEEQAADMVMVREGRVRRPGVGKRGRKGQGL